MASIYTCIAFATFVSSNPIVSIYKYESPPTRWMTDGITIVGVTDGLCNIETNVKQQSKWAAGVTSSVYKANNIINNLQNNNFKVISNPYNVYGEMEGLGGEPYSINAKIMFYYGNCKILMKNESDITEQEYSTSYSIISSCANHHLYNSVDLLDSSNNKKEKVKLSPVEYVIMFASIIGGCCFLACCYVLVQSYCCKG